jgi:hypothetical protein
VIGPAISANEQVALHRPFEARPAAEHLRVTSAGF